MDRRRVLLPLQARSALPGAGASLQEGSALATWLWLVSRPLARDEHRARFWVRHVRIGVALSELTAGLVVVYAVALDRPAAPWLVLLAAVVIVGVPGLLALPMHRWSQDHRGGLLFYAWSTATTVVIFGVCLLDGGVGSPLTWLLVLTLTFAALAYPPVGVLLNGALMIAAFLAVAALAPPGADASPGRTAMPAAILAVFTVMTAWASRNQWDMADQQQLLAQRLGTLADTDELTSCLNRRAFGARLRTELALAGEAHPLSLCVVDLDGFKRVNDSRGHAAGDVVLVAVARCLLGAARETDSVSRLGGDEFAVLLPGTDAAAAAVAAQRLVERVRAAVGAAGVSASVGVVTACSPGEPDALLASADHLMYDAKTAGGSQARAASA